MSRTRSRLTDDERALQDLLPVTPSSWVDPVTPWVMPYSSGDHVAASAMWFSFGLTSTMLHSFGLVMALIVMPFSLSICAFHEIKPVEKMETVTMTMVAIPPPPPPEPEPPPPPPPPEPRLSRMRRPSAPVEIVSRLDARSMGLIALLSSDHGDEINDVLSSIEGGSIEGGLIGATAGDSIGGGGLGVIGGVEGGVVSGRAAGLGGIGTAGIRGNTVSVESDVAAVTTCLRRWAPRLRGCVAHDVAEHVFVVVKDSAIADVEGGPACVKRALVGHACNADDQRVAVTVRAE